MTECRWGVAAGLLYCIGYVVLVAKCAHLSLDSDAFVIVKWLLPLYSVPVFVQLGVFGDHLLYPVAVAVSVTNWLVLMLTWLRYRRSFWFFLLFTGALAALLAIGMRVYV